MAESAESQVNQPEPGEIVASVESPPVNAAKPKKKRRNAKRVTPYDKKTVSELRTELKKYGYEVSRMPKEGVIALLMYQDSKKKRQDKIQKQRKAKQKEEKQANDEIPQESKKDQ